MSYSDYNIPGTNWIYTNISQNIKVHAWLLINYDLYVKIFHNVIQKKKFKLLEPDGVNQAGTCTLILY